MGLYLIFAVIFTLWALNKANSHIKDNKIYIAIKQKLIWSSLFRGQIQFYFPMALSVIAQLDEDLNFDTIASLIKLCMLLILPGFSFIFLQWKFDLLEKKEFK